MTTTTTIAAAPPKSGLRSTEFWFSSIVAAWGMFGHALPPVAQAIVVAVATAFYSIARAVAKLPPPAPSPVEKMLTGSP
jgi:hypothetical protein